MQATTMQWLESLAALAGVLLLFMFCAWVARLVMQRSVGGLLKASGARMAVLDSMVLDARHRMVLARVDDDEMLLIIGGQQPEIISRKKNKHKRAPEKDVAAGSNAA